MEEEIRDAVERVVGEVFENMYFMFPELVQEHDIDSPLTDSCFKATVKVIGASQIFVLYASEQLVKDMTNNLLGADEALNQNNLVDMFTETANVIAGNLMTALALDTSVSLDIPITERLKICSEARRAAGAMFSVDGHHFKLAVVN